MTIQMPKKNDTTEQIVELLKKQYAESRASMEAAAASLRNYGVEVEGVKPYLNMRPPFKAIKLELERVGRPVVRETLIRDLIAKGLAHDANNPRWVINKSLNTNVRFKKLVEKSGSISLPAEK
jgi:hypothetical protein